MKITMAVNVQPKNITTKKLDSGYVLVRGIGVCEWAQPRMYPCSEKELRASAFPEASESFIQSVLAHMK